MAKLLTPVSLWNDLDDSLDVNPVTLGEKVDGGVKYEYVSINGRDTGAGRVTIYGVLATSATSPSKNAVLVLPDSRETIDETLLNMLVGNGFSAFAVDLRGEWEGCKRYTLYPDSVYYANTAKCGRYADFVDQTADKTCWYEWVGVGVYARKYMIAKLNTPNIGVLGIRDGGEVAFKLITAAQFSCAVTVCAGGWKAYRGYSKFSGRAEAPTLSEERYRFIAGIDSQSFAPYVKCPVLMLCAANDSRFDCDRAYDTFARINPKYAGNSVITYSVKCNTFISVESLKDTIMFLNCFVKQHQVFIPRPADIGVNVDDGGNLVATLTYDQHGIAEKVGMYVAEEVSDSYLRDWTDTVYKGKVSANEHEFYLTVHEKADKIFLLGYVTYTNGFTVWSKLTVKKLKGKFKNCKHRCNLLYSGKNGVDCFTLADNKNYCIGGVFIPSTEAMPKTIEKAGIKGMYCACGLTTYRMINPVFAPEKDSILKLDVFADEDTQVRLRMTDMSDGTVYKVNINVIGGVWQSLLLSSKMFKTDSGSSMHDYARPLIFTIKVKCGYAVNNLMWL